MRAWIAAAAVLALARPALADDACSVAVADPVGLPWRDTGFDAGRAACARPGATVDVAGHALIDTPAFYGTLGADAELSLRLADGPIEWLVAARLPTVSFVQNAVLAATEVGYGPVTVGALYGRDARLRGHPLRLAIAARLDLPYSERRLDSERVGGQLAGLATWRPRARWLVHGRLALLAAHTWSELGTDDRAAAAVTVDVARRLGRRFAVGAGLDLQLGWYGAGLDHLAARLDAQARIACGWRLALALGLPAAGAERTDLAFALGVTRDL